MKKMSNNKELEENKNKLKEHLIKIYYDNEKILMGNKKKVIDKTMDDIAYFIQDIIKNIYEMYKTENKI